MDVTAKLLQVYQVDKQLRGLRSRLTGAEKFLSDQDKGLTQIEARKRDLETQLKQHQVSAADAEGEVKRLDVKLATLRKQMETAQSNKEYKAFLTELNTFKADRDRFETVALEVMAKVDDLKRQLAELVGQRDEREKVRKVAASDRDARHGEIADRLKELSEQRAKLIGEVPADVMLMFQRLIDTRGDDAMASIEIVDAKRYEFHCAACMMSLPVDAVSGLLSSGKLTKCSSCQCILYLDDEGRKAMQPSPGGKKGRKQEVSS